MDNPTSFEGFEATKSYQPACLGRKVGVKMGRIAESAGAKFDLVVDRIENCAENVKFALEKISEEGVQGLKKRAIDYARKEPLNALLLAMGSGILVGWATKRK
jgi:hypothetical protein